MRVEVEEVWDTCMWKVVKMKKLFGWKYIYDKDFQKCFKSKVLQINIPDGILFGDPSMQVSKYGNNIIVTIFSDSDNPEDWETIIF